MSQIKLNPAQKKAVEHAQGPLLIVAGAGTGKTTVLVERLKHLIAGKFAEPDEILIVTFTEKAAGEMEDRALKALPYGVLDLWIHTFHGFCERILREHALDIGLPTNFKLFSDSEQWMMLKKNLPELCLDYYQPLGNPSKFFQELLKHFSRLKDENITPAEYLEYAEGLRQNCDTMMSGHKFANSTGISNIQYPISNKIPNTKYQIPKSEIDEKTDGIDQIESSRISELAHAYHMYNRLLVREGALDFGDLICRTLELFKKRPNILANYRNKFKYVMVDEFQDTNWAQYELIKMVAAPANNLTVVGDDDQAIYKFRGASLSNIMQFKDDYPDAVEAVLNDNYRSGQIILDAAYAFIRNNNPNRLEVKLGIDKRLISGSSRAGAVKHLNLPSEGDEQSAAAQIILELKKEDKDSEWSDFCILARSNESADKYTAELTRQGIPNELLSQRGLYLKPAVLDSISYLKLLDNYHESSALFRVLSMDVFRIEHADIIKLSAFARRKAWSLFETLQNAAAVPDISPPAVQTGNKLIGLLSKHSGLAQKEKASQIFLHFANDSGMLKKIDQVSEAAVYSYLNQFYQRIKRFEEAEPEAKLKDFMEYLEFEKEAGETGAVRKANEDSDTVKVMTVHASKGLEWKHVIIVDLVDKKFPTIARSEKIAIPDALVREKLPEDGNHHVEEERRLFYVAMTRAKESLFLLSAKDYGGAREKKPSVFIVEAGIEESLHLDTGKRRLEILRDMESLNNPPAVKRFEYPLPEKFSFSQLEAFANCPLQYKFAYILKIPIEEKVNFIFGRLMHNTLRDFFLGLIGDFYGQPVLFAAGGNPMKKTVPPLEHLLKLYAVHWKDDGYPSKKDREEYRKKGRQILADFHALMEQAGWPQTLAVEKNFQANIGGFFMRGSIDRIDRLPDGSVEIVDYKTGHPKDKLGFNEKRQLLLYSIVVEELLKMPVKKLTFHYLENNEPISFAPAAKDIEKLKLEIVEQITAIRDCEFPPKAGPLCRYCDFSGICEHRRL